MNEIQINVKLDKRAILPKKAHDADAGFDLYAIEGLVIPGKGCGIFDTGVHFEIPKGYVGFLKSKSGLNIKYGILGEGVIDSGYTGSVVVKLYNDSPFNYQIEAGDKISQIVFLPIPEVKLNVVDEFSATERGDNGFGSTGR